MRRWMLILGLFAAGCAPENVEFVRRHDVQRARWHVDRDEVNWTVARRRDAHLQITDRFGVTTAPTSAQMNNDDWWVSQEIAGTSALYAADLAARYQENTLELAAEYGGVASRFAFDEEVRLLARFGQGRTLERLGRRKEAAEVLREVVRVSEETIDAEHLRWARRRLSDLEVHLALFEVELGGRTGHAPDLALPRERLLARADRWQGQPAGDSARRRAAELAFLSGEIEVAVEEFTLLALEGRNADERAEVYLALGEIHHFRLDREDEAERYYRLAVGQGVNVRAAAVSRVRLTELYVRRGLHQLGIRTVDGFLGLGARAQEGRREEALYWRARCLLALDHWEDAILSMEEGASGDPASPFTLACAARLNRRMRTFRLPDTEAAADRLVAVALSVPEYQWPDPPREWGSSWQEERDRFAWREGLDELKVALRSVRNDDDRVRGREAMKRIRAQRVDRSDGRGL